MIGCLLAIALSAPAADLSTPSPAARPRGAWEQAEWPAVPSLADRERRARDHAIGAAGMVLGAGYGAFLAAIVEASVTCEPYRFMDPACETTAETRRAIARGTLIGLAIVPPIFAARGVARADPRVRPLDALVRALPWHLAGVALATLAAERTPVASVPQLALLGVGAALSLYAAPHAAARAPPRPSPAALALPARDPALPR